MSRKSFWIILKREITESTRDWGTLTVNYLMPILIWPVSVILISNVALTHVQKETLARKQAYRLVLLGEKNSPLTPLFQESTQWQVVTLESDIESNFSSLFRKTKPTDDFRPLRRAMKKKNIDLVLRIQRESSTNHTVQIYYDQDSDRSKHAQEFFLEDLDTLGQKLRSRRLASLELEESDLMPLTVERVRLSSSKEVISKIFGNALPFVFAYLLCLSTALPAIATFVGEREKGTLALLTSSPVPTQTIVWAKFAYVIFSGLMSLSLHALSISVITLLGLSRFEFELGITQPFLLIGLVVSLATSIGGLAILSGILSRTIKQGEGVISAMILFVLLPGGIALVSSEITYSNAVIPILSAFMGISKAFATPIPLGIGATIIFTNLAFGVALLLLANQVFIANSAGNPVRFSFLQRTLQSGQTVKPGAIAGARYAILITAFGAFASLYVVGFLPSLASIVLQQALVFALLPVLIARVKRLNVAFTFQCNKPNLRSTLGGILIGFFAAVTVAPVIAFSQVPTDVADHFKQLMDSILGQGGFFLLFTVFALLPAICEELFFRGALLTSLRSTLPTRWAVILSSILFGLMHFFFVRIVITTFIGMFLAVAVVRSRSIFVSMLAHLTYNGIVLTLTQWLSLSTSPLKIDPMTFLIVGTIGLAISVILTKAPTRKLSA